MDFFQSSIDRNLGLKVEKKTFWISRLDLANLSPVFKKMLYGDFRESIIEVIELPDKTVDEILELLQFLFCKKEIDEENLEILLKLGDEYSINSLIESCSAFIIEKMRWIISEFKSIDISELVKLLKIGVQYKLKYVVRIGIRVLSNWPIHQMIPYFEDLPIKIRYVCSLAVASLRREGHKLEYRIGEICQVCRKEKGGLNWCRVCNRMETCYQCSGHRSQKFQDCFGELCSICGNCGKEIGSTDFVCECIDWEITKVLEKMGL